MIEKQIIACVVPDSILKEAVMDYNILGDFTILYTSKPQSLLHWRGTVIIYLPQGENDYAREAKKLFASLGKNEHVYVASENIELLEKNRGPKILKKDPLIPLRSYCATFAQMSTLRREAANAQGPKIPGLFLFITFVHLNQFEKPRRIAHGALFHT